MAPRRKEERESALGENGQSVWRVGGDGAGFRKRHGLPLADNGPPVLCVLPGSRPQEIRRMLPIFRSTVDILADQIPGLAVVVPTPPGAELRSLVRRETDTWRQLSHPPIVVEAADSRTIFDAFAACDAALAVSGTVVTQLLLARLACVVAYRAHPITELVARHVAAVRYASLPNILLDKEVVPEFLFSDAVPTKLAAALWSLLTEPKRRHEQHKAADKVLSMLSPPPLLHVLASSKKDLSLPDKLAAELSFPPLRRDDDHHGRRPTLSHERQSSTEFNMSASAPPSMVSAHIILEALEAPS